MESLSGFLLKFDISESFQSWLDNSYHPMIKSASGDYIDMDKI